MNRYHISNLIRNVRYILCQRTTLREVSRPHCNDGENYGTPNSSEWGDAFPNKLLGAATIDRIRHGAYNVSLDGKSFRSEKPLPSMSKSTIVKGGETICIFTIPRPNVGHQG
jgi:hypothetical protein